MARAKVRAMGDVCWVIQSNRRTGDSVEALNRAIDFHDQKRIHLAIDPNGPIADVGIPPGTRAVVCHGPAFVSRGRQHRQYSTGVYFDPDAFRYSTLKREWGPDMLCRDAAILTYREAVQNLQQSGPAFVRPDQDSKAFAGGVYDADGLKAATKRWMGSKSENLVIASRIEIDAEWRFFLVEGRVVASSSYRFRNRASIDGAVPAEAAALVTRLASRWSPHSVCCIDVGKSGSRIGIVEANCFNAARFYAADVGDIVLSVSEYAIQQAQRVPT